MLLPSFLTCRNGCTVAYGVRCRPHLAVFQQLQGLLPALALRTRTDGCTVAGRVRPYLLSLHGLQKSKRVLPLHSFLACSDGGVVADGVWCRPCLAVCQDLKCKLPTLTLRTSTDGCAVAGLVRPYLRSVHGLQKSKRMLPLPSFLA